MKRLMATFCATSSLALVSPAYAQASGGNPSALDSPQAESETSNDAIIVTARRRDEDVQSVPLVVNTVTAQAIGKLNLQNFTEIQNLVPGLQLSNTASGVGASAQIRGVTFDINASTQPSVEFYLNDAPLTSSYILQQMYDIGQIEVLRGPQGTLRGRSSPSGSIAVTTKKPSLTDFGGNASLSASDTSTFNFNAALGVPIIEDILAVRAAGLWTSNQGNRVTTINRQVDGRDPHSRTAAGRVSVIFKPSDWLKLEGVYQHADTDARSYDQYASFSLANPAAPASPRLISPRDRLSIQESPRNIDQKFDVFNWRGEARFAGQVLIYQGQYAKLNVMSLSNSDNANFFTGTDYLGSTHSRSSTKSHEVRLQNEERLFGGLDYVVGYFNWKQESPTVLLQQTPVLLPPSFGGGIATVAQTQILTSQLVKESSIFGNLTAHIGGKFQISAGTRYIHFTSPANFLTIGANVLPGAKEVNNKDWIYSLSAQYFVTPDVMIYANTGTSRRPGPTIVGNFSLVQSDRERSFGFLDKESSTSYELGIKSTFFDRRMRFNLTGYHQTFKGYPYKLTSPVFFQNFSFIAGTGIVPNVGSSAQFAASVPVEVNGLETEIGFKVTPHFDLSLVASYSLGKIKNGLIPCNDLNADGIPDAVTTTPTLAQVQAAYGANYIGACRSSQRSSNQSPFSATIQAEYNTPLSDQMDFFARGLLAYQGNSLNDPSNAFDNVGSYGLLNMFAGLRDPDGAWELNFFAKNLLNTTKATSFGSPATTSYQQLNTSFQASGATATSTYSIITTTPPREFGVNVRFAFGSR